MEARRAVISFNDCLVHVRYYAKGSHGLAVSVSWQTHEMDVFTLTLYLGKQIQRDKETCPKSHSCQMVELGLKLTPKPSLFAPTLHRPLPRERERTKQGPPVPIIMLSLWLHFQLCVFQCPHLLICKCKKPTNLSWSIRLRIKWDTIHKGLAQYLTYGKY